MLDGHSEASALEAARVLWRTNALGRPAGPAAPGESGAASAAGDLKPRTSAGAILSAGGCANFTRLVLDSTESDLQLNSEIRRTP